MAETPAAPAGTPTPQALLQNPSASPVHRGTRAVQRMVEHAPSTGGLALWVHHQDAPDNTPQHAAPAWTDGITVHYRTDFSTLPLPRQAAWVAHEVLHIALRHAPRYQALRTRLGHADLQLFNVCADAIVNSTLAHVGWLQLPPDAVRLDGLLASVLGQPQDAEAALLSWDVERLYLAVDDRRPRGAAGGQPVSRAERGGGGGKSRSQQGGAAHGAGNGTSSNPSAQSNAHPSANKASSIADPRSPGSSGGGPEGQTAPAQHAPGAGLEDGPRAARARAYARPESADLHPGPGSRGAPEDEAAAAREWIERLLRAHAGDGPQSMLRTLLADLPRLRTPWEQALRSQLAHGLAQKPALSWSRPARSWLANQGRTPGGRRLPWEPGISATRPVPHLVVVVDVSGSIEPALLERFAGEIEAISRRLEAALVLVVGDERVQHVQRFEPGHSNLRSIRFQGGGGTDFTPLLEEAQRHRPDITVVLTDLEGPARFRPRCPVIWAVPDAYRHAVPPFGRLLVLH